MPEYFPASGWSSSRSAMCWYRLSAVRWWPRPAPGPPQATGGAFPIMLVNDTENHAHQGLATFLYRPGEVTGLVIQFVQQTGPYLIKQYFVGWGFGPAGCAAGD